MNSSLHQLAKLADYCSTELFEDINCAAQIIRNVIAKNGTLYFIGNGGAAADAQHIAAEYIVRFRENRAPLKAIALTTDTSLLTAAGNDLGFEHIFARQIEALVTSDDILIAHTTSGNSPNIIRALEIAKEKGVVTLVLTAKDGGRAKELATHTILVPTNSTARAQEIHLCIQHSICEAIEDMREL